MSMLRNESLAALPARYELINFAIVLQPIVQGNFVGNLSFGGGAGSLNAQLASNGAAVTQLNGCIAFC